MSATFETMLAVSWFLTHTWRIFFSHNWLCLMFTCIWNYFENNSAQLSNVVFLVAYFLPLEVIKRCFMFYLVYKMFQLIIFYLVVIQFLWNWNLCTYNVLLFRFSLIWHTVWKVNIKNVLVYITENIVLSTIVYV